MDITLSPGAHLQWRCPEAIELQVCAGRLWLTMAGDVGDRFLVAGDRSWLPPGQWAMLGVEGSEPLRLQGRWAPSGLAGLDIDTFRRRAHHQREVARRWWWRGVKRRVVRLCRQGTQVLRRG